MHSHPVLREEEKKEVRETEYSESGSEEESEDYSNYASEAEGNTSGLMIGSFMNNRIKRRPKLERIYL